jgi:hypothetical protein
MQLCKRCFPRGLLQGIVACLIVLALVGCTYKPGYLTGVSTEVSQRWKVEKIAPGRLSADQRATLDDRGPPTYVRFFREVETRDPVYAWIYADAGEIVDVVWFVDGKRVENIAVDSDPSAFSSNTRRRTRLALLVGTGAAILPTVLLLANR